MRRRLAGLAARRHLPDGRRRVWQRAVWHGVWQTWRLTEGRLADGVWHGVWQTADANWQTPTGRRRLGDVASGRRPSGRRLLADAASGRRHARRRLPDTASARRPSARHRLPDGPLPDAASGRRGVPSGRPRQTASGCQTCQTLSARRRLVLRCNGLSTRVNPGNEARLNSCVF